MPSPQSGADSPRMCSARTKEEVMANARRFLEMSWDGEIQPETRDEKIARKAKQLEKKDLMDIATKTASLPRFEVTGPHLPHDYQDERQRTRLGRFGAVIND